MIDFLKSLLGTKAKESSSTVAGVGAARYAYADGYADADHVILVSCARLSIGLGHQYSVSAKLALPVTDEQLGLSIQRALDEYLPDYELPENHREKRQSMLKAMGYRSERQLQMQTICCCIARTERGIEFTPTHNGGTSGDSKGFQGIKPIVLVSQQAAVAEFGKAFRSTLNASSTIYDRRVYL